MPIGQNRGRVRPAHNGDLMTTDQITVTETSSGTTEEDAALLVSL